MGAALKKDASRKGIRRKEEKDIGSNNALYILFYLFIYAKLFRV